MIQESHLNPFALPAETNQRFVLLVVVAIVLVVGLTTTISLGAVIINGGILEDYADTVVRASGDNTVQIERYRQQVATLLPAFLLSISLPILLLALTGVLASFLYQRHPQLIIRRKGLVPLQTDQDKLLVENVHDLVQQAGLSQTPDLYIENGTTRADGQVWGVARRYGMRLGKGARLLVRKQPEIFRAVVRHELGHIANGDIDRTYLTQALWSSVLILTGASVVVGLVIAALFGDRFVRTLPESISSYAAIPASFAYWAGLLLLLWTMLPWVGLVVAMAAIRASILRTREVYADWRAALWGSAVPLNAILSAVQERMVPRWRRPWTLHPDPRQRAQALKNSDILFTPNLGVFFIVGFLIAYILYGLVPVTISLLYGSSVVLDMVAAIQSPQAVHIANGFSLVITLGALVGLLALMYFSIGVMGTTIQRQALLDLKNGRLGIRSYLELWLPAGVGGAGVGAGMLLVGFLLVLPSRNLISLSTSIIVATGIGIIISACIIWCYLVYVRFFALRLFATIQGVVRPRSGARHILGSAMLLVWLMLVATIAGPLVGIAALGNSYLANLPSQEQLQRAQSILEANPTISMTDLAEQAGFGANIEDIIANSDSPSVPTLILISLGAMGVVYLIGFGLSLLIQRASTPTQCLSCNAPLADNLLSRPICPNCGQGLAAWAYVDNESGTTREQLEQAYLYRDKRQYTQAQTILSHLPDSPETHNLRGILLEALGQPQSAKTAYDQALELRRDYTPALANRKRVTAPIVSPVAQGAARNPEGGVAGTVSSIVGLAIGFLLIQQFGSIFLPALLGLLLPLGGAWLIHRFVLKQVLSERAQFMKAAIALLLAMMCLLVIFSLFMPDFGSDSLLLAFYLIAIAWLIVDPGLTPTLILLLIQGGLLLPLNVLTFLESLRDGDIQFQPLTGIMLNLIVIFLVYNGYQRLNQADMNRYLSRTNKEATNHATEKT